MNDDIDPDIFVSRLPLGCVDKLFDDSSQRTAFRLGLGRKVLGKFGVEGTRLAAAAVEAVGVSIVRSCAESRSFGSKCTAAFS